MAQIRDVNKKLVRLECDFAGCRNTIKPHPEIAESGWRKLYRAERNSVMTWDYCPDHAHITPGD